MKKSIFYLAGIPVICALAAFFMYSANRPDSNSADPSHQTLLITHADWYKTVTDAIMDGEYRISETDALHFTAVNRNTGLRFQISPEVLSVTSREETSWGLTISLKGIYCGDQSLQTDMHTAKTDNTELNYINSDVQLQYINQKDGLRQNFIIASQPVNADKIIVELEVETSLSKELVNNALIVKNNGNEVYRYTDLVAIDAAGKKLSASMHLKNDLLSLEVNTKNADFPVTIDPLSTTPDWKVQANQVGAHLGFAVSTAGDVNNDGFDDVIVGALAYDAGEFDEGRAFVYLGSAAGLSTTAIWQYESNNISALFGKSVAGAGDINGDGFDDIIVGAGDYSGPEELEGKAYMFYGNATGVNASPAWTYESNQEGAALGYPLETIGDANNDGYADIIVGCNSFDNPEIDEGVAYVFYGSAAGLNTTPDLTIDEDNANCRFGHSVSSAGDVNGDGFDDALVGGYNCSGVTANAGACFLYYGSDTGIVSTSVWNVFGDQTDGYLGFWSHGVGDVNKDGYDDVMVGAKRYDNPENDEGKAWLYLGSASGLSTVASWTMEGNNVEAEYANQFSGAGDVNGDGYDDVVMGAHFYTNTITKEGSAYVYLGGPSGLSTTAYWTVYGAGAQVNLGWSADGAGDINHDGFDDIIIGLFKYVEGEADEGAAEAFYGSSDCTAITTYAVTSTTSTSATATWPLNPSVSVYKLYAKGSGESHVYVSSGTSYTMTGLTPGKKYKTWIQPKCGSSWGMRSNVVNVVLPLKIGAENTVQASVFPNPAKDEISFNTVTALQLNAHISIYSTGGELIKDFYYEKNDMADKMTLDIRDLSPALYFYTITTTEGLSTGSFIKN